MSSFTRQVIPEKGAVFAEAALALFIFFGIVLGFIDFTQMMAIESQLTVAAEQALTVAATDPGIDAYDFKKSSAEQSAEFTNAQNRVLDRAKTIAAIGRNTSDLQVTPSALDIPRTAPYPGAAMSQVLETAPIQINLSSSYRPLLAFLPTMTIRAKAVGYREPRKMIGMPNVVDCNGNVLGSPLYKKQPCPYCSAEKMWDFDKEKCVCRNNNANEGTCDCPAGKVLTADYSACVCESVFSCGDDFVFDNDICDCKCKLTGAVSSTGCRCASFSTRRGDDCTCDSGGRLMARILSGESCIRTCIAGAKQTGGIIGGSITACACDWDKNFVGIGVGLSSTCVCGRCTFTDQIRPRIGPNECASECVCGTGASLKPSAGTGTPSCQCDDSKYRMGADKRCTTCVPCSDSTMVQKSFPDCSCSCGPGATLDSATGKCVCDNPNYTLDAAKNCTTTCVSNSTCPLGEKRTNLDGRNCACTCGNRDGLKKDPVSGMCNLCSNADAVLKSDGTGCTCPYAVGSACGSDPLLTRDSSCNCICDNAKGLVASGDSCKCSNTNKVVIGGECKCPVLTDPLQVYIDPANCTLGCKGRLQLFDGKCVQRSCAVDRCKSFTIGDGSCAACPER